MEQSLKVAIFGDLQIHNYKQHNQGTQRLENCIEVLFVIAEYCKQNGIKYIIFTGDMYDTFGVLLVHVVNQSTAAWLEFAKRYPDLIIFAITGNHDMATKNLYDTPAVSSIQWVEQLIPYNFRIIDNQTILLVEGVSLSGIPYYEYKEHYSKRLDERVAEVCDMADSPNMYHYLVIHQTARGIANKMIPYDTDPIDERYANFHGVFCGHIHQRSQLADNFYNVGSPIHRDSADEGQQKGFMVLDVYHPSDIEFVPITGFPEFVKLYPEEITEEVKEAQFVIEKTHFDASANTASAKVEQFNTNLDNATLMRNFWQEVNGGKDEKLLATGIGLLTKQS